MDRKQWRLTWFQVSVTPTLTTHFSWVVSVGITFRWCGLHLQFDSLFVGGMGVEGIESRPPRPNSELQRWHFRVDECLRCCHNPGKGEGLKDNYLLKIMVFLAPEQFKADLNAQWIMITFTAERSQKTSARILFKHDLTGSVCLFFFWQW